MGSPIHVPFLGRDLVLDLPPTWEVVADLRPSPAEPIPDLRSALQDALRRPVGRAPLGSLSGRRVCLAVEDISRPTPTRRYLSFLLSYLHDLGARSEDIVILFGLGVHRPMTRAEMEEKVGPEVAARVRMENHDCRDPGAHVNLGVTSRGTPVLLNRRLAEADLIVCVGAVEPHVLLGFGGGLKMILPGLAHERTIAVNHMQGVSPQRYNWVGEVESPMRLDLEEAVSFLSREVFIVNAVLGVAEAECGRPPFPVRFVCGDPVAAHREGARLARDLYGRKVPGPVDVAIVASHPMDADLRQGMKSIANVEAALGDNGQVLAFLECRHGIGDVTIPARSLPNRWLRTLLRLLGPGRILPFVDRVRRGAGIEERFLGHFSMQVVRKARLLIHAPNLPPGTDRRLGLFTHHDDPREMLRAAARKAPRRARVLISPYGGVTYPILSP